MESRRITRKQAQQQSAGSAAGSPVVHSAKESVMPTAKKAGSARRTTSRKPLADRTNDSPIFGLTPCGNKTGGRKSSPIYERTPISKLRSFKSCTPGTPGEEILRSQVQSMLEKVKANEQSMGDALQYYSPLFSSSSAGGSMSQRQYYTPATSFPTVNSQSPVFPLSTEFQEEGLQAQTDMWHPVKSNPELQMEQPLILATSKDKTCGLEEQEQEDGGLLPLDMQLLYMFGKAAAAAPASDSDANDASSLDLDVLKAVEKQVITRMEDENPEAKGEDEEGCDGEADTDGVSDQTELPNLWKQRGGRSVKITEGSVKMVNTASQETTTNDEYQEYEGNYEADEEEEEGGEYEELCRGISHISMRDSRDGFGPPPFAGRHTRFHYNSEGEIDSVQVDEEEDMEKSPEGPATPTTVMRLRGLPTPKGKHLRFTEDI
ncbi:hypothetical protein BDL97_05G140000 [Sphagnum fallax]|nr:hypothetical protein BDL97_05G140000 [Sphagnum fallax]